jgi:predicted acylesterase/phospholipase RssA
MSIPFRKLALGSGGVKGILHIGGLRQLQKYQSLEFPDGIYGCSIGSIFATYLSFNLPVDDRLIELTKKYMKPEKFLSKPTFRDIAGMFSSKGLLSMHSFEECVIDIFKEAGIDIQSKKIGDSTYPLYIVASNISKGIPTIFSKDVPILEAIKCSCCIPGVFKPQELYGQIYLDGGLFVPCLSLLVKDALCFTLSKNVKSKITPKNIESIHPLDLVKDIHIMTTNQLINLLDRPLVVDLKYPNLYSDSELSEFDVEDILKTAEDSVERFFVTKGFLQKLSEISN